MVLDRNATVVVWGPWGSFPRALLNWSVADATASLANVVLVIDVPLRLGANEEAVPVLASLVPAVSADEAAMDDATDERLLAVDTVLDSMDSPGTRALTMERASCGLKTR